MRNHDIIDTVLVVHGGVHGDLQPVEDQGCQSEYYRNTLEIRVASPNTRHNMKIRVTSPNLDTNYRSGLPDGIIETR